MLAGIPGSCAVNQKAVELIDRGFLHHKTVDQNTLHREADREAEAVDR